MVKIAASILAADETRLEEEILEVTYGMADIIHIDVMDGNFVNNTTDGKRMIKAAIENTFLPLDVHLMVKEPLRYLNDFKDANIITFHIEAVTADEAQEIINQLHSMNKKVGIAIKPNTTIEAVEKYIKDIDRVLVMTVEPGFGGQKLIPETVNKVKQLREKYATLDIEVDGGINQETCDQVIQAGANILVAGTAIFKCEDRQRAIKTCRGSVIEAV